MIKKRIKQLFDHSAKDALFKYTRRKPPPEVPEYITAYGVHRPALAPYFFCISRTTTKSSTYCCSWYISGEEGIDPCCRISIILCFSAAVLCNVALLFFSFSKIALYCFLDWSSSDWFCLTMRLSGYKTWRRKGIFSISNYV